LDWVVVDVAAVSDEVFAVAYAMVREPSLPDGKFGFEAAREAAFEEHHCSFEGDVLWCEKKVDVIRHDDEGVEFVVAFAAVALERVEKKLGVGRLLEEAAAIPGLGADEESAVACCSGGDSHGV